MKYVFIDMDGTIAEWGYPDGRISGDYQFGDYFNKQPINDVIAEIYNPIRVCLFSSISYTQQSVLLLQLSEI